MTLKNDSGETKYILTLKHVPNGFIDGTILNLLRESRTWDLHGSNELLFLHFVNRSSSWLFTIDDQTILIKREKKSEKNGNQGPR